MPFALIAKHPHIRPISGMCGVLGVSRSGVHAWLGRPLRERAVLDAQLVQAIDRSFKASDRTYGARRVWHDVLEEGLACGLHRIERLLRQNAMRARPRRRGKPRDDSERSVIADNILDRDFRAENPNQKWLADFSYIWTTEGWHNVAVMLDLFSRRVVGRSMKADPDATLVMDALIPIGTLLRNALPGSGWAEQGNVWDNSAMESFFSSLRTERTARKVCRTRDAARAGVFDYILCFYNPRRRHSKLGYRSPVAFEARAMQT